MPLEGRATPFSALQPPVGAVEVALPAVSALLALRDVPPPESRRDIMCMSLVWARGEERLAPAIGTC